ncbi:MAG: type IV secretion system DNA-binding domain-containing protein [Pseudomonadota bacterium]
MSNDIPSAYNTPSKDRPFMFGNRWLSATDEGHFLLVGSTRSGKTINISILLKHVLKHRSSTDSGPVRLMIYDSKTDQVAKLSGLIEHATGRPYEDRDITILNPFDSRCCAWDMAADIEHSSMAADVAAVLAPIPPDTKTPYFPETAQQLLEGVITAFIEHAPGRWTLRDVIQAAMSRERLEAIFQSSQDTLGLLQHFNRRDTFNDVLSTLYTKLRRYHDIAACWEAARVEGEHDGDERARLFSLTDWMRSDRILVLGNRTRMKEGMSAINQLLFTEASKVMLDQPGSGNGETWFFLDEVQELGRMETLGDVMNRGGGKGARVVLGFQDIGDMDAVYTRERARSIVGAPQNVCFLHINDSQDDTQRWASHVVGERQDTRTTRSHNRGTSSTPDFRGFYQTTYSDGASENEQVFIEPVFLPSQFGSNDKENGLPKFSLEDGMYGLYRIHSQWIRQHFAKEVLLEDRSKHNFINYDAAPGVEDMRPWSSLPRLAPWTKSDAMRLGLPKLVKVISQEPSLHGEENDDDDDDRLDNIRRIGNE